MQGFKPGDIVRVFHYPFIPKVKQQEKLTNDEVADEKQSRFFDGKARYGVVVGSGGDGVSFLPIVQIMSHEGKTKDDDYTLRDDEVRMPSNIHYKYRGKKKEIEGVIKMERIEMFSADEISTTLTSVPLRTKIALQERYLAILNRGHYKKKLNEDSPEHGKVMTEFADFLIAERLGYLESSFGEQRFGFMKDQELSLEKIQRVGTHDSMTIYAVGLRAGNESFDYHIMTSKDEKLILKHWANPKKGIDWFKEDAKYHMLARNMDARLPNNPLPHPDKYRSFKGFEKMVKRKERNKKGSER